VEKRIRNLFDFQRFSPDPRLTEMIADVQSRYKELPESDLEQVAAAGEPFLLIAQEVPPHAGDELQ